MKPTMTWLKTADGVPSFEEVKGKFIGFIRGDKVDGYTELGMISYGKIFMDRPVDYYIIIDPLVEEPLEYKGVKPKILEVDNHIFLLTWRGNSIIRHLDSTNYVTNYADEEHTFVAPTRAAVIAKWNRFVIGE